MYKRQAVLVRQGRGDQRQVPGALENQPPGLAAAAHAGDSARALVFEQPAEQLLGLLRAGCDQQILHGCTSLWIRRLNLVKIAVPGVALGVLGAGGALGLCGFAVQIPVNQLLGQAGADEHAAPGQVDRLGQGAGQPVQARGPFVRPG